MFSEWPSRWYGYAFYADLGLSWAIVLPMYREKSPYARRRESSGLVVKRALLGLLEARQMEFTPVDASESGLSLD